MYHGSCNGETTAIRGYVIGQSHDRAMDFLMYYRNSGKAIRIDRNVEEVNAGRWLNLIVNYPDYNGEFVLSYDNCSGFDDFSYDPSSFYVFARFFPLKKMWAFGEVVMAVRVKVVPNHATKTWEYDCYEINPRHFIDTHGLLHRGGFYKDRVFIVELQSSLSGWIVLKCHENPGEDDFCDELTDPVAPYDVSYLDETDLPSVLTKNQQKFREPIQRYQEPSSYVEESSSSSYYTPNNTNQSVSRPVASENSDSNHNYHHKDRKYENRGPDTSFSSSSHRNSRNSSRREEEVDNGFDTSESDEEEYKSEKENVVVGKRENVQKHPKQDEFFDVEDLKETMGTSGLYATPFIDDTSQKMLERLRKEAPMSESESNSVQAICIAVQKFENFVLMFTPKKGVVNVLLNEDILNGRQINVGDIEFFNVTKRRKATTDPLNPPMPFDHIAISMMRKTEELSIKAQMLYENVRSFGNLLEVKIEVNLNEDQAVTPFYDNDMICNKQESERRFYILKTVNKLQVTIPCGRLQHLLNENFKAKFVLQAWAARRRQIGGVCLHIGAATEVVCIHEDGKREHLPPLSNFGYMSGLVKNDY